MGQMEKRTNVISDENTESINNQPQYVKISRGTNKISPFSKQA